LCSGRGGEQEISTGLGNGGTVGPSNQGIRVLVEERSIFKCEAILCSDTLNLFDEGFQDYYTLLRCFDYCESF
jgi:hypothetical protein